MSETLEKAAGERPEARERVQDALAEITALLRRHRLVEGLVHEQLEHAPLGDHPDRGGLVESLVTRQNKAELQRRLDRLHPADIAYVLEALPLDERLYVWDLVKADRDGEILLEVSEPVRESLISSMDTEELVAAAETLDADEIAELAPDLPQEVMDDVFSSLPVEEREQLRAAMSFEDDMVGALMDFEDLQVRPDVTLEVVLRYLRRFDELPSQTDQLFVVDRDERLLGVLPVNKLIVNEPDRLVGDVMQPPVVKLQQRDRGLLHQVLDEPVGLVDDELVHGQHAQELLVAVHDEDLVRLRRKLVEAAQVSQHDLERHVGTHLHVLKVHERADHVVLEGHGRTQLLALLDGQAREDVVHHLLREVRRELGDLLGVERLGRGDELLGVHRGDERLADGLGDLEQDLAVAVGLDQVPDVEPLVERQRLEDVGDVRRMQAVEPSLELRLVLLGDEALDELAAVLAGYRRMLELVVDEAFDEARLAQERGDLDHRVLNALAGLGAFARLVFDGIGHEGSAGKAADGARDGNA